MSLGEIISSVCFESKLPHALWQGFFVAVLSGQWTLMSSLRWVGTMAASTGLLFWHCALLVLSAALAGAWLGESSGMREERREEGANAKVFPVFSLRHKTGILGLCSS